MEKADCIVVGAGPSGTACAISLAQKGFETVLLERARQPGEKNVASAVVFTPVLEQIVPEYLQEAPLERKIGDHAFVYLTDEGYGQLKMRFPEHYRQKRVFLQPGGKHSTGVYAFATAEYGQDTGSRSAKFKEDKRATQTGVTIKEALKWMYREKE